MLALSSPLSSTDGWRSEELKMSQVKNTWTSKDPFLNHSFGETQGLQLPSSSISNDPGASIKKLNHNASERDRRKKLNNIYASLRSLLPWVDQTVLSSTFPERPLSIPATISRALKYIPELQNQVGKLKQRKLEILSSVYSKGNRNGVVNQSKRIFRRSIPNVSISQVDKEQVMIQICASKNMRSPLSDVLLDLEEGGLEICNVSASASSREVVFYNLYVQTKENQTLDTELLCHKLLSMCESRDELF